MKSKFTNYTGNYWWGKDPEDIRKIYIRGKFFLGIHIGWNSPKERANSNMGFCICREETK